MSKYAASRSISVWASSSHAFALLANRIAREHDTFLNRTTIMSSKSTNLRHLQEESVGPSTKNKDIESASLSPKSITSTQKEPRPPVRPPTRSVTFDSVFHRQRSKSPAIGSIPESPLQHSQTAPATTQRHKSEGSIPTSPASPSSASFLRKRVKETGSLSHYGRHGNDWIFGGWGIRETAKGLVKRQDSH